MKRWIVRAGEGSRVADILRLARVDERAVAEGRVFVGKRRALRTDDPVRVGDEVRIGDEARGGPSPTSSRASVEPTILLDDDGLLACVKPAGLPTVPDHAGASHALVAVVARAVGRPVSDLRVTSRLDREVSGVVVFATSEAAEARLRTARAEGRYARRYVAIAAVQPTTTIDPRPTGTGVWDTPIGRGHDPRHRRAAGPDAKPAETRWAAAGVAPGFALLAVSPITGRTHRIRVHASHAGMPLFGDRDYGGPTRVTLPGGRVAALARIALHAARVSVPSSRGELVAVEAPIPMELCRLWGELGGSPEAWEAAVAAELGR